MNRTTRGTHRIPDRVLMLLPANVVLLFLVVVPTIIVIWLSFINFQPTFGASFWQSPFAFFDNYAKILKDKEFLNAVLRTIAVSLICLIVEFGISLLAASILSGEVPGKKVLFPLLIVPLMVPSIVVGNTFWLLFSANGPVNQIISVMLGTQFKVSWFSHPQYALMPIIASEIWRWYPLMFLILFSGFAGISTSEIRAARILGASEWKIFLRIKLPKLRGPIIIALVIRLMEALKVFDVIHLLTRGGPGTNTETISYSLFKYGFKYSRVSYISAGAWLILLVSLIGFSLALRAVMVRQKES